MIIILLIGLGLLAVAGAIAADVLSTPARERRAVLQLAAVGVDDGAAATPPPAPFSERVVAPVAVKLARLALRLSPRTTVDQVRLKLLEAGLSRRVSPTAFLAGKAVAAIGGAALGLLVGGSAGNPLGAIVFALLLGFFGLFLPSFFLSKRASARCERIASDLPKATDLLAVSVEAGLGFDAAVAKLITRMDGPLIDEFETLLNELRIGEGRERALRRLNERVPAPELGSFVRSIIQSETLGIALGKILRTQAMEQRRRRQVKAEEQAMKAPVKMLFPTVLFIFPAMFIVILAPAVMKLMDVFSSI